jgi:hypothetical protein
MTLFFTTVSKPRVIYVPQTPQVIKPDVNTRVINGMYLKSGMFDRLANSNKCDSCGK